MLKELFLHNHAAAEVTVQYLSNLLVPVLSPDGHNRREREEAVLLAWSDYLQDMEGMYIRVTKNGNNI